LTSLRDPGPPNVHIQLLIQAYFVHLLEPGSGERLMFTIFVRNSVRFNSYQLS